MQPVCFHRRLIVDRGIRHISSGNFGIFLNNLRNIFRHMVVKCNEHLPPVVAPRPGAKVQLHDHIIQDDFSWLQYLNCKEIRKVIQSENRYTDHVMRDTRSFQTSLVEKLKILASEFEDQECLDLPVVYGHFFYYTKKCHNYPNLVVHCRRRKDGENFPEEVIFDESSMFGLWKHIGVKSMKVSPSERFVAFIVDVSGDDTYCGIVVDMSKNPGRISEQLPSVNLEWAITNEVLYYTTFDHIKRADKVWRHFVGSNLSDDVLVFEEKDDRFFVDVSCTKDRRFITINSNSKSISEVHILDATKLNAVPQLVRQRETGIEYYVEHHHGTFYILTNFPHGENYQVMTTNGDNLDSKSWTTLVPPSDEVILEDMDIFSGYCVLYQKEDTLPKLSVLSLQEPLKEYKIKLPGSASVLHPGFNLDFNSSLVTFTTSSPAKAASLMELNMETKETDSTEVPITIFHKKDIKLDGQHPILVHVYGSYGMNVNMDFSPEKYHLLTQDWILAFCHVRGGGELGRRWYHKGRLKNKNKCFEDFEACIRMLQNQRYSSPHLTAVMGTSAGGLPVAVLCNITPHLIRAAVLKVPFVDVMSAMLDQDLALTAQEFDEFGNPRLDADVFNNLKSFCPYLNISNKDYPNLLLMASVNDVRVPYWMPLKFVKKLRHVKAGESSSKSQNMLLLKTDFESGHFGAGTMEETAFIYAFLYKSLGLPMV